jgi:predicted Zn finger-like uncharacterized protein
MILNCEVCKTNFNFPENLIKETGSKVRCSKCHHVFVAYPAAAAQKDERLSGIEDSASDEVAELGGVDLNEIDDILDTPSQREDSVSDDSPGELDLDLDLDLPADEEPVADTSGLEFQETEELDFSDLDLDEQPEESDELTGTSEDMDFSLDLDLEEDAAEEASSEETSDATEELDFELDLDSETDSAVETAASETEEMAADSSDELDFELDLDLDDAEQSDDAEFDQDLEQTHDLDVSDMENLIDLGGESTTEDASAESDELDFELDLESDTDRPAATAPDEVEETAELDLSDLEDMIDAEEDAGVRGESGDASEELDLELTLESDADEESEAAAPDSEFDATEEFDFSDLDRLLDEDEDAAEEAKSADALDDVDLNLEVADDKPAEAVSDLGIEETAEFDLSDLEDVLETEEEQASGGTEALADEVDLALDQQGEAEKGDELFDGDETADVELEFEIEDTVADSTQTAATAAASSTAGEGGELVETFDMGTLADGDETIEGKDAQVPYEMVEEGTPAVGAAPKPAAKRQLSGPFRIMLILVLFVGGGYAAYTVAQSMGINIDIPYANEIKKIRIPYVSDYFAPKVEDRGNLKIRILAQKLDGWFVENARGGKFFVIKGQVRNGYDHPRNFIRVMGKVYSKGGKHSETKTVYAGNVLSDADLTRLDEAAIDKKLRHRFGINKSNLKIKTGKVVPFMIVFSKLPPNPDEYSVQVASSRKGQS